MAQTSSASAAAALNWNAAESNIERFNQPYQSAVANTYGFRGFTDNNMFMAKQPLRHQASADIPADANRYFRRDSPPDWEAPAKQQPVRLPSPTQPPQQQQEQRQKEPDWMQTERRSPAPVPDMTISPRYEDQRSHRHPTIRDPLGQLTADEKRKKIEEHYIAKQDLEGVRQRREEQKYAKLEEQQKRYGVENRGEERVRSSMEQTNNVSERKEEMLEGQSKQLRNLQEEINRLKAQDDLFYSPTDRPFHDNNPRAQSEPQTERGYRMRNCDGESSSYLPDYMQTSPRRPIGRMYNSKSTYVEDFNIPFGRRRYILGNPNKETYEAYAPYGLEGGGAPRVNADGQRRTRIAGAMHFKDVSDPPKAGKEHKMVLRQENRRQAANDIVKKNAEMAHAKEGYVETVDVMRSQYVGYPKYNESGTIASHPLYHTFNRVPYTDPAKKTQYHAFLASQIEEKNRNLELGHLEEIRQAREHFLTEDRSYGREGGGNIKGQNLRKVNLNKAIHNPQSTRIDIRNYMGQCED